MSEHESRDGRRERWLAVLLSVLVHAGVVGALAWGWWRFRTPPAAAQRLAIEATVVTAPPAPATPAPDTAPAATPAPVPVASPAPAPEAAKVKDAAEEQQRLEDRQREERAAAAKRQEQEAAERAARARAQLAAKDKVRREAELRAQLAAEERVNAARGSAAETAWLALIRDRVTRAWIRPPSARVGVNCEVHVTQVPGGVVTGVQIGSCNGDAAVRESIEAAVYRASPLPSPASADLFDRNLRFNFHPDE
jgi:colicin import membrane protein